MEKRNIILEKTYQFSLFIISIYKYLYEEKKEYVLSKQLLRSGTSIGANSEEASVGVSRKDFINKYQIAYKEAKESHYWLRLLRDSNYLEDQKARAAIVMCEDILRILNAILKTSKMRN